MARALTTGSEAAHVLALLGGKKTLGCSPRDDQDYLALLLEGLPFKSLECAAQALTLSLGSLEENLHLSVRTLQRRRHSRLSLVESERVMRLVRVAARAEAVLGSRERAQHWLHNPNRALNGQKPIALLYTELGGSQVLQVLGRIEYSVYD